jgi:ubiquitin-conjugating enzyme E2 D
MLNRLKKELNEIKNDPPINISAGTLNNNIYEWEAVLVGPEDTPYHGGIFYLDIYIPIEYPIKPPNIIFKTKIFHPNINSSGHICLDILKTNWNPSLTISKILLSICSLLNDPNTEDPLVPDIANMYNENNELYINTAKTWTLLYAT